MRDTALPSGWPADRSLAVSVNVMLEGWTDDSAPGIGPMGNPLKPGYPDLQARSWAEYGPKTGMWRLLDLLADRRVTATVYVSGIVAERHPDLMRRIASDGHAIGGHAYGQNIVPVYQEREEEARDIARCVALIDGATGARPRGWISPRVTPSPHTAELLVRAGFTWHCDYADRDLPYLHDTPAGRIVAIPFTMEVNDMPLYIRYGNAPDVFTGVLRRLLDGWAQPHNAPACLDVTVHAHVFGRPFGAIEFGAALDLVRAQPQAWLTSHAALAALYAPR
ncbi:MAG TPA: polysaccharide deacetylase family protein [Candidatus Sulfotelmatobacter sp.]|nr:polysaccharide deacetylase family protein [Candidatus Sulfotelmatobacter sp.]